jgi:DNA polymerase-4
LHSWLSAECHRLAGIRASEGVPNIVHLDIESYFASVEQALRERVRGKAVLVVSGGVVASASREARRRGVVSGMAICDARKACPNAFVVPGQSDRYADLAERVRRILRSHAPIVEMVALGSFYLDFSSTAVRKGDFESSLRRMQVEISGRTGLNASIGAGTSRVVASLAAREHRPCGLRIVAPGTEARFLSPFPVEKLRSLRRADVSRLAQGGIATIGDLQAIPKPVLLAAFGAAIGKCIWECARGCDGLELARCGRAPVAERCRFPLPA